MIREIFLPTIDGVMTIVIVKPTTHRYRDVINDLITQSDEHVSHLAGEKSCEKHQS